jgi:outer membrane protein OmpA-like peptidoglycan-associated protein
VQIARAVGADRFASDTFAKAEKTLAQAEAYQARKAGTKPITMTSRETVQTAEDARAIAAKRQEDDALTAERALSAGRELSAENGRIAAQSETNRVTQEAAGARANALAEADRVKRDNDAQAAAAQNTANRLRQDNAAQAATAQTEAARLKLDNEAKLVAAQTEADRLKRDSDAKLAATQTEADRVKRESDAKLAATQADAARVAQENAAQRASAQALLDRAAKEKQQLEAEKTELRSQLLLQFNTILQTRDSARGLIVNMSDVIFDTGKSSLLPGAREKLSKVAGIVSGHPGLILAVEGHTDNVGTDSSNQLLSEQRGKSVRDYLVGQGMATGSVSSAGLGETQPVATNDTSVGRQQNRRVEIVISGDIIGKEIGVPIATR